MGPVLRIAGTWVVTTILIVLGVNAAIERVARDVDVARPAPMTPSEVDEKLREQHRSGTATTGVVPEPIDSPPPTSGPTTSTATGPTDSRPPTVEPSQPEVTIRGTPGGPPVDVGTTTTIPTGPSDRQDVRDDVPRP